ncbi:MAG: hypothetical protein AB7O04_11335, partial [Hyphomonadaceae bacterium]
ELGAIGAGLAALALAWGGFAASRAFGRDPYSAAAFCGALAAGGVIANVSYGAWQEWWITTLFIGAALINLSRRL